MPYLKSKPRSTDKGVGEKQARKAQNTRAKQRGTLRKSKR